MRTADYPMPIKQERRSVALNWLHLHSKNVLIEVKLNCSHGAYLLQKACSGRYTAMHKISIWCMYEPHKAINKHDP